MFRSIERNNSDGYPRSVSSDREQLVDEVLAAGRVLSTAAVMFHATLAAQVGLSATENKALELIDRHGPMTPARLAEESGLAPASVTALLDRLERKGAAVRVPHPHDGRRVLVEIPAGHLERTAALFEEFTDALRGVCEDYDDGELRVVIRFIAEAASAQQRSTARLTGGSAP